MASHGTSFSSKLRIAFGALLLVTLAIAWYFFQTVRTFEESLENIKASNQSLESLETLSVLTFRKLLRISDSVASGASSEERDDAEDIRLLLADIRSRRNSTAFASTKPITNEPSDVVPEIEGVVEEILVAGERIQRMLSANDVASARREMAGMRSADLNERFANLMARAITDQQLRAMAANNEAYSRADTIITLTPVLVAVLVALMLVVVFYFSRNLGRSMDRLHDAVVEFTRGNLEHRIPEMKEREFSELGEAFNNLVQDLSEHRDQLEAMVEERTRELKESNEKLARVDENRRMLFADLSHEFRTPLTVIRGEADIALRGEKSPESYRESLRRIVLQADHTTRLVDDLLFIARAGAGEPKLELRSIAIVTLVNEVCTSFRSMAESKNVSIEEISKSKQATVRGDASRLRQVFNILLDNAVRYSNPGGRIRIDANIEGMKIMISVHDQGIGLTEEEASQAFERFFRGAKAGGHARGTGLGLPVAKAIVEAHNGRISLTGEPGQGAVAVVQLPIEEVVGVVA